MDQFIRLSDEERHLYFVQTAERMRLRPQIVEKVIEPKCGSARDWSLVVDEDDPDRQTLLYASPSRVPAVPGTHIRPAVRIEMGARSDHWPSDHAPISPYVAQQYPAAFRAPEFVAKVLVAERTFWEKATLLHAEYHRPPDKEMPPRLSRHYYDVSRLIVSGLGGKAAGNLELLQRVVEHKKVFFQSGWARYDEARRGSLRVMPLPLRIRSLEEDYPTTPCGRCSLPSGPRLRRCCAFSASGNNSSTKARDIQHRVPRRGVGSGS